jgi:cysteine synthase A
MASLFATTAKLQRGLFRAALARQVPKLVACHQRRTFFNGSPALMVKKRGEGYGTPLNNISETIGNTPMVKVSDRICPEGRTIYAKCEFFNPLSSVKDRLALAIIEAAEKEGKLKPGDTVIEATSGNTGIAVAMMCAQRGYDCVITMAEPFSVERRKIMRMLGAKVIVTPKAGKGTGMVVKASELAEKHGWFLCHQFETDANWKFHETTTGPEICNDLKGKNFDYWVTGYGTGGT